MWFVEEHGFDSVLRFKNETGSLLFSSFFEKFT